MYDEFIIPEYDERPVGSYWTVPESIRTSGSLDVSVNGLRLVFRRRNIKAQDNEEKSEFKYGGQPILYGRAYVMSLFRPAPGHILAFRPPHGDMPDFRAVLKMIYSLPYDDVHHVTRGRGFYGVNLDTREWIPVRSDSDMLIVIYVILQMLFASAAALVAGRPCDVAAPRRIVTGILDTLEKNPYVSVNSRWAIAAALKATAQYDDGSMEGYTPREAADRVLETAGELSFVKEAYDVAKMYKRGQEFEWKFVPPYWIDLPRLFEMYTLATLRQECGEVLYQKGFKKDGTPAVDGEEDVRPDFLVPSQKAVVDAKYSYSTYPEPYGSDVEQMNRYSGNDGVRDVLKTKRPAKMLVYPSRCGDGTSGTVFSRAVKDTAGRGVTCSLVEFPTWE